MDGGRGRRLAAFVSAWLLAALFAGAAMLEPLSAQAETKKAEPALSQEELQQRLHEKTLEAWKKLKDARQAYEKAKCGTKEEEHKAKLDLLGAENKLYAALRNEASEAPEVAKARAELEERQADMQEARRNPTIPESYREEATRRWNRAYQRHQDAVNKEHGRIRRDLEAGEKTEPPATCPPKSQTMVPPAAPSVTGEFYVGIEGLKNTGDQRIIESEADTGTVTNRLQRREDPLGVGIVVGYNVAPWNNIVVGPFASLDYLRQTINHTFAGGTFIGSTTNWVATFGVKAGLPVYPGVLIYGLTGLGVLNETLNINFGGPITSSNKTVPGFALGGGAEWRPAMLQGWGGPVALFVQYQHTWWDDAKLDRPAASPLFNYNYKRDDDTIRFGFNIYFNGMSAPPPPPRRTTLITK
jgi:opacity protein-like surface antigen